MGSNAANPAGYGAVNGYIGGLADTVSTLTHLGARDLDPVLGVFTSPDPVLKLAEARNFSPYVYGEADAVNNADPSGLAIFGPALDDGGSWHGRDADVSPGQWHLPTSPGQADNYDARDIAGLAPVFQPAPAPAGPSARDTSAWPAGGGDNDETMAYIREHGVNASAATALRYLSFDVGFIPSPEEPPRSDSTCGPTPSRANPPLAKTTPPTSQ
ncbi:RHS repeat-associated core domain-containing protein [Arthrobacter sp. MMS24-S77]